MNIKTVGSVCSGIEAASVAWEPLGMQFQWFSEIAEFPSRVLKIKYPQIPNLGDMNNIPSKLLNGEIDSPDFICGGTPCQAFSFAGWQNGLNDDRGNLTLKFVDIIDANDKVRLQKELPRTIVFWENVEGVLTDKTNAFGCLVSSLAGLKKPIENERWPNSGFIRGKIRNVAWRVLDAKYFGLPQQRKRLYLIAGGPDFFPENVLLEDGAPGQEAYPNREMTFEKEGHLFEVFREYTDCLYAAYGTKWNGNAAATNGSLFVVQDGRIRRLSPLETERLMGFPDSYTELSDAKKTNRYQATGNSWAVPVVKWLGNRLLSFNVNKSRYDIEYLLSLKIAKYVEDTALLCSLSKGVVQLSHGQMINGTTVPEKCVYGDMKNIVSPDAPEDIYISPVGCYGIVRRKMERKAMINPRLEEVLLSISSQMSAEEIEKRSRVQRRGRFSDTTDSSIFSESEVPSFETSNDVSEKSVKTLSDVPIQLSLFD